MINNVGQAFADQLDLEALIELVGDQLRETFSADIVYVALHDEATGLIDFPYFSESGGSRRQASLPFGEGLSSRILVRASRSCSTGRAFGELGIARVGTPANSYLGVPILVEGRAIGVISVQSTTRRAGSARATRGCCRRSPPTWAPRSRTPGCTGRRSAAPTRWPRWPNSVARSAGRSTSTASWPIALRAPELLEATRAPCSSRGRRRTFIPIVAHRRLAEAIMADAIDLGRGHHRRPGGPRRGRSRQRRATTRGR